MHEARAMTAYYRSDSSPCSLQTLLANGDFDSDMVYEDAYPSPSSPATLSAPPTPRTHQSPMTTTMFPACNDDPTMTSPPPPPPFPDQQDSPEAFCEFVFFNGFQQGRFSDIGVFFPVQETVYAMHRIIMVRSPVLYRRLMAPSIPNQFHMMNMINVYIPGSREALHLALGHLYQPFSMDEITYMMLYMPSHQPPVRRICDLILVAYSLELPLLQRQLIQLVHQHLNKDTMISWMNELVGHHALFSPSSSPNDYEQSSAWIRTLDNIIIYYLVYTLPPQLLRTLGNHSEWATHHVFTAPPLLYLGNNPVRHGTEMIPLGNLDELIHMYAKIPMLYLKPCLEHKDLLSRNTLWRYDFAKRVLCEREGNQPRRAAVVLEFPGNTVNGQGNIGIRIVERQTIDHRVAF